MAHPPDSEMQAEPGAAAAGSAIYLVAALAANRVIGAGGQLPWHLPEDLKHFKQLTLGHAMIMGRKTWQSIGRPLPGRDSLVVTRQPGFRATGARVVHSLHEALACCAGRPAVFVIGGGELYREALPRASGLMLTEIQRHYEGDTRFPEIDASAWRETAREPHTAADGTRFDFVSYARR